MPQETKKSRSWVQKLGLGFIVTALLIIATLLIYRALMPRSTDEAKTVGSGPSSSLEQPSLTTSTIISGLDHPWDIAFLPDETLLMTERGGDISIVKDGKKSVIEHPDDVAARGEGGMLGLAVDPEFSPNRYIYTCFNSTLSGLDVRVARWKLSSDQSRLEDRKDIIINIPANPSGRHSGCRIGFGADGNLWVGTGDAADANSPQDLDSLGGKILRVNRNGSPVMGNIDGGDPRVYSFGHRNTQGLAFYKEAIGGSYGVSVEHGPGRDDEVNALAKGNFGWAPGAGYGESVPMTDTTRFPGAILSMWSSGDPTIAPSDASFLYGTQWGKWQNRLAMGVLKDKHLRLIEFKTDGTLGEQLRLLDGEHGRLRAVTLGPDNSLYISTDNGGSEDKVLRVQAALD